MTEAETRIARTFRARDWEPLTPAFIRIVSFVDGRVDLALACINRDLLEGRLRAALVAPDGTIKMRLAASDWQRRTVHAPHNPAEGVRVEPYEEGRFFIWRADLDREYPTNPATPASAADRQLYAADGSEPAAGAKPAAAPHPGGRKPAVDWEMVDAEIFRLMDHHDEFSPDDPEWNAQARLEEAIADFCQDKFKKLPGETQIREHVRPALERWRRTRSET